MHAGKGRGDMAQSVARGWLYNEATDEKLAFQFNPEIQDTKGTSYERHKVPGLSHPVMQFVAGDSRQLRFRLELSAVADPKRDLWRDVTWLRALQYPVWGEGVLKSAPPRVVLVFGQLLSVRGVMTNVDVLYQQWDRDLGKLQLASVALDMEEYAPRSVNMYAVLKGGGSA